LFVRFHSFLTRLLVLALLLQWGTAFAHCLRFAPAEAGFAVDICTPDGIHRVVLPGEAEDGERHVTPPAVTIASPILLAQAADPPPPRTPPPQLPPRSCQPSAPPTS
jgi:hypothetical protein